ncbi:MAG: DHH family phosphoesterase [Candidatus Hadarchaeales archaeon]
MKEAAEYLRELSKKHEKILVLCHHNVDVDGGASAIVLSEILRGLGVNAEAGAADDISSLTHVFLSSFGRHLSVNPPLDCGAIILVDTSSFGHLGKFGEAVKGFQGEVAIIDHHRPVEEMREIADFYFVREDFSSESELIFKIMEEMKIQLSGEQASLLLGGIITDTAYFRLSRPETFEIISSLIKAGADYHRVLELLHQPEDLSKRIAMLKAAQRLELQRVGNNLVVFSELGSFEGDAANVLVKMGADVAFVGNEEKGNVRVSARGRLEFIKQTGIHLGEILEKIAKEFGGNGGGHPGAASMNVHGKLGEIKERLFNLMREKLS